MNVINQIEEPVRRVDKPLRISVREVSKITGIGTVAVGRVEYGIIEPQIVLKTPQLSAECRTIEKSLKTVEVAGPGDIVGIHIKAISVKDLRRGDVLTTMKYGEHDFGLVESFTAQIMIINFPTSIFAGFDATLNFHTAQGTVQIVEILKINGQDAHLRVGKTPSIKCGDKALVKMSFRH